MPDNTANERARRAGGPGRRRLRRHPVALSAILAVFLLGWITAAAATSIRDDQPPEVRGMPDLRVLFRSGGGHEGMRVGRLAIQLVQGEAVRQTGLDHHFRTGDMFRFEISSNQTGWLYVLHRSPAGEPKLLWPRLVAGGHLDDNRVWAGETSLVPPTPDVFLFDDEVGSEYFYVVIRPERQAPELSVLTLQDPPPSIQASAPQPMESAQSAYSGRVTQPVPAPGKQKIVQFSVRSMGAGQKPMRGVVLLPGGEDPDPNAYFAPDPNDAPAKVVFEFRLRHGD